MIEDIMDLDMTLDLCEEMPGPMVVPNLCKLMLTLFKDKIPELDPDVEAYEVLEEILQSSPEGSSIM